MKGKHEAQVDYDFVRELLISACKYIQKHPPAYINPKEDDYSVQLGAVIDCNKREDGWKQWLAYFIWTVRHERGEV